MKTKDIELNSLPPRPTDHHSSLSILFASWKNKVGGGILKSGDQPKIVETCYYNGYVWAHNYNGMSQASWEGKCWLKCKIMLLSKQFEGIYQNHWTFATQYQKVVLPCSHHLGRTRGPTTTNSVAHTKSQRGKLLIPLNGRVGRDQNWKCIHEGIASHLLAKV